MAFPKGASYTNPADVIVPGTYWKIFVNGSETYVFGERGRLGIPLELDWGNDNECIEVNAESIKSDCIKLFGCEYNDPKLRNLREAIDGGAQTIFVYKLNHGEKATGNYATAKHSGVLGNTIDIVIEEDPDSLYVDHPLKNTAVEFSTTENIVTGTISNLPEEAELELEFTKDGVNVEGSKFTTSTAGTPITLTITDTNLEAGDYELKLYINKLLLTTAKLTVSHVDATEAKMKVSKDNEIVDGTDKESLSAVSVEVTASGSDNTATVTYTGLSEIQKAEVKVMADQMVAVNEADKVNVSVHENTATVTFGKLTDASKEYSLQINVLDSDVPKDYGKQALTIVKEGENKDAYSNTEYSDQTKEDYSKQISEGHIVSTYVSGKAVDSQKVKLANELIDNDYVIFNKAVKLTPIAGDNLTGGTNGTVTGSDWEKCRNAFEPLELNNIAAPVDDVTEQKAWVEYTKRLRDKYGVRFQLTTNYLDDAPKYNYEGVITVGNKLLDEDLDEKQKAKNLVYWVAGAEAGCKVQSSCIAKAYTGSYKIDDKVTYAQMEEAIKNGILLFHNENGVPVVLKDINTLTKIESQDIKTKSIQFRQNQAIRVLDAIAIDTANIFNTYFLGKVPNDETGRNDLKNRIIKNREAYARIGAIDTYDASYLEISAGDRAEDVLAKDAIRLLNVMEYLFFEIEVLQ